MTTGLIVGVTIAVFLLLLALSTPVAFALAASGGIGIALLTTFGNATSTGSNVAFYAPFDYSLSVVPLYILLGMLAVHGKLSERIFRIAGRGLRGLPGGLGVATVAACAGFSAVSGSSLATAASLGKLSVAEMRSFGYRPSFATGIVATAGTLGVMIPPSVLIVIYAVLAQESIGEVLAAGILPGVLAFLVIASYVMLLSRRNISTREFHDIESALTDAQWQRNPQPALQGARGDTASGPDAGPSRTRAATSRAGESQFALVRAVLWIAAIFAIILAGTFTGLFTIVQSAAIGALVALVMLVVELGSAGIKEILVRVYRSLLESAATTSMAFGLMIGAGIFSVFLVLSRVPIQMADWVSSLDVPPIAVVALILAMLIPLGMFLDAFAIIIILAPIVHPIVVDLGFDGVWFAILFIVMIEIGMITPPVGMNAFVVSSATGVPLEDTFKGLFGFVLVMLGFAGTLLLFPDLVLFLPGLAD